MENGSHKQNEIGSCHKFHVFYSCKRAIEFLCTYHLLSWVSPCILEVESNIRKQNLHCFCFELFHRITNLEYILGSQFLVYQASFPDCRNVFLMQCSIKVHFYSEEAIDWQNHTKATGKVVCNCTYCISLSLSL